MRQPTTATRYNDMCARESDEDSEAHLRYGQ